MKYNKNIAIEFVLRKLIGKSFKLSKPPMDDVIIHELYGEELGNFFFLMENLRTKDFFTMDPRDILITLPSPYDNVDPSIDNLD